MEIYLIGLNHRTAGVEVRERFALAGAACAIGTATRLPGPEEDLPPTALDGDLPPADSREGLGEKSAAATTSAASDQTRPGGLPGALLASGEIREGLVLSTCNRVEILAVSSGPYRDDISSRIISCWAKAKGKQAEDLQPYVYCYRGAEAVRHLFTVASSLDSMVLGEPQILGPLYYAQQ